MPSSRTRRAARPVLLVATLLVAAVGTGSTRAGPVAGAAPATPAGPVEPAVDLLTAATEVVVVPPLWATALASLRGRATASPTAADPVVIDVMVLYQQVVATRAGGDALVEVEAAIERTNQTFANSDVPVRFRLVHEQQVPDADVADLDAIRTSPTVALLRSFYGADLVQAWGSYDGICGTSYQNTGVSMPDWAYSLVDATCTDSLTVTHEWGHNLGAGHDKLNQGSGAFPYSYGWVSRTGGFRTVMTYDDPGCPGGSCVRIPYFSNPNLTYLGEPLGDPELADNARTVRELAPTIAAYRTPVDANAPAVDGVLPRSGPWAGGTTVLLHGSGFLGTRSITVGWANVPTFYVLSDSLLVLTTPANFPGWWSFRVTDANGTSPDTLAAWYQFQ